MGTVVIQAPQVQAMIDQTDPDKGLTITEAHEVAVEALEAIKEYVKGYGGILVAAVAGVDVFGETQELYTSTAAGERNAIRGLATTLNEEVCSAYGWDPMIAYEVTMTEDDDDEY